MCQNVIKSPNKKIARATRISKCLTAAALAHPDHVLILGSWQLLDYITPLRGETHGLRSHSWQNFLHFFLSYFRGPSFFLSWVARLNMWARCGFVVFDRYAKDKQSKQRHWLKLGKKRRESSKRNYYIISPRVIIIAIIIWIITRFKKFVKILRFYFRMTHRRRKLVLS